MRIFITYLFLTLLTSSFAQVDSAKVDVKLLLQQKEFSKVVDHLEAKIDNNASFSDYYNLGIAYTELNDLRKGLWSFESALKIDPLNEKAQHNASFVYSKLVEGGIWTNPYSWLNRIVVELSVLWIPFVIISTILLGLSIFLSVSNIKPKRRGLKRIMLPSLILLLISLTGLNLLNNHFRTSSTVIPIHNGVELYLNPEGTPIDGQINLPVRNQLLKYSKDSSWVCLLNKQERFWLKVDQSYIY